MGSYPSTYVGIYMVVPDGTEEETKTYFVHPTTGKRMKTKFCPDTGAEGVKKKVTKTIRKYADAYIDEEGFDEDMFFSPEYDGADDGLNTFILNRINSKYAGNNIDGEESYNVDITTFKDTNKLIEEFKEEYKKYIDYYEKEYGKVSIHFGVAHYYH